MLRRKAKKWKFDERNLYITDLETIKQNLNLAIQMYRQQKKCAKALRISFLEEKSALLAAEKGIEKSKYLKQLLHIEEAKDTFKKIRYTIKPNVQGALHYVEEGPDNGTRNRITNKEDMEEAIQTANISKLTQADNTPLRESPLSELLHEQTLDFDQWERALDPTFPIPPHLERGTKLWFQEMRHNRNSIPPTPTIFDPISYKNSWKKIKEDTSSQPGLHFGHFKAMDDTSLLANKVHSVLAETPLRTGYSPTSWQQCTDAMIKKKVSDMRPSKLRLITLMNAVFNHNNKQIGRKMMKLGEQYDKLAPEQYGSRKHKSAIEHALNKVLTLDISRQKREALIFTANDAVSCYDRIVLLAAYCSMLNFGVTKEEARSLISTLGLLHHSIRTAKGDSIRQYGGHTWVRLPHGIGQGNGAGPPIWACVSSPLFDALRNDGYGTTFQSPISLIILNITGFSFVDDADLIQSMGELKSEDDLFIRAQAQLIVWEQLLRTTGGAIDPNKSDWLFLRYKWNAGK